VPKKLRFGRIGNWSLNGAAAFGGDVLSVVPHEMATYRSRNTVEVSDGANVEAMKKNCAVAVGAVLNPVLVDDHPFAQAAPHGV